MTATAIDEAAACPNGAVDDQVDALTQALRRLNLQPPLAHPTAVPVSRWQELAPILDVPDTVGVEIAAGLCLAAGSGRESDAR